MGKYPGCGSKHKHCGLRNVVIRGCGSSQSWKGCEGLFLMTMVRGIWTCPNMLQPINLVLTTYLYSKLDDLFTLCTRNKHFRAALIFSSTLLHLGPLSLRLLVSTRCYVCKTETLHGNERFCRYVSLQRATDVVRCFAQYRVLLCNLTCVKHHVQVLIFLFRGINQGAIVA